MAKIKKSNIDNFNVINDALNTIDGATDVIFDTIRSGTWDENSGSIRNELNLALTDVLSGCEKMSNCISSYKASTKKSKVSKDLYRREDVAWDDEYLRIIMADMRKLSDETKDHITSEIQKRGVNNIGDIFGIFDIVRDDIAQGVYGTYEKSTKKSKSKLNKSSEHWWTTLNEFNGVSYDKLKVDYAELIDLYVKPNGDVIAL